MPCRGQLEARLRVYTRCQRGPVARRAQRCHPPPALPRAHSRDSRGRWEPAQCQALQGEAVPSESSRLQGGGGAGLYGPTVGLVAGRHGREEGGQAFLEVTF